MRCTFGKLLAGWRRRLDSLASHHVGATADLVNVTGWHRTHQRYARPRAVRRR